MKYLKHIMIFIAVVCLATALFAFQESPSAVPSPIDAKLPEVVSVIAGVLASIISEFVQKQKSPLVSLGIAAFVSVIGGVAAAFIQGASPAELPVFIVQTWTMATATWAVVFKGLKLNKKFKTSE